MPTQKSEYTFFFLTVREKEFWVSRHKRFIKGSLLQAQAAHRIGVMCTPWHLSTLESLAFMGMPQRTRISLKIIVLTPTEPVKKKSVEELEYRQHQMGKCTAENQLQGKVTIDMILTNDSVEL